MIVTSIPSRTDGIMSHFDLHIFEIITNPRICFILRKKVGLILKISNMTKWIGLRISNTARCNRNNIIGCKKSPDPPGLFP
jgi:hypothetical protein